MSRKTPGPGGGLPAAPDPRYGGFSPHPIIIGESYRDLAGFEYLAPAGAGDPIYEDKYHSNVVTESYDEATWDLGKGWSFKAGMSMDGFFRPFSTNYNHQAYKAAAPPGGGNEWEPYANFEEPTGPSPNLYDLNPFPGTLDLIAESDDENSSDVQLMVGKSLTEVDGSITPLFWDLPTEMNPRKRRRGCVQEVDCAGDIEDHTAVVGKAGEAMEWYRALGLRGPLVVVGWGYDTNGKPVPPSPTDPNAFLLNHRKRQDKWKAGPVDLRWDNERKVWAAGGGGGAADIWLSQTVNPVGSATGPYSGLGGNTYTNLACGGSSSYCISCSHDAIAMFKAGEDPFYEDTTISTCKLRKNQGIEIVLEEPKLYIPKPNGDCDEVLTNGGWLAQPVPAGTYMYTLNTGRVAVKNGESYPVHWILQAQFCQTNLITSVGCNSTTQGCINIATCTRDIWFEGTSTEENCFQPSVQCP